MAGDQEGAARAYALVEKIGKQTDRRTLALFYATKNENADKALELAESEKKVRGDIYTDDAYAWALHRNHRDDDAKVAIDRALSHGTKDARLLFHSGAIRLGADGGRDAAAGRKLIEGAIALNPKFDVSGAAEAIELLGGAGDAGPSGAKAGGGSGDAGTR